ncbi:MAG TPA: polysaccharide biosynthesis/export family protein [Bacteroidales bacterium]|jgi:polysaccharide export outer membrane protein|nr:polysaccharide biosynthesis/export family protein [Bacteroidales bacterium]
MKNLFLYLLLASLLQSCVTARKTTYLQPPVDETISMADTMHPKPALYKILPSDNLFIRVITPDPKWAAMFNTMPVATTMFTTTEQSTELISYPVMPDGTIDIPYVGHIQVSGKTLPEIKELIERSLADYITDYDVTVRLVNNYISILGDVNKPGRYAIYKDQLNIFQALAMAGDLGDYSDRYQVQIVRQTSGGTFIKEFDLTKRNIISSEFFYVMPNDVIYARPMKGKFFKMNTFPFSIILSTVTTAILIANYIK